MLGYHDDPEGRSKVITEDGWLYGRYRANFPP
jgi:hypothetical protein